MCPTHSLRCVHSRAPRPQLLRAQVQLAVAETSPAGDHGDFDQEEEAMITRMATQAGYAAGPAYAATQDPPATAEVEALGWH